MEILKVAAISKAFGGVQALREVSLAVEEGSITGLIGPNGAGKTTLFNVITGMERPDSGRVLFAGQEITGLRPYELARLRILRTFQRSMPFGEMTVLENVICGGIAVSALGALGGLWRGENHRRVLAEDRAKAHELLKLVRLDDKQEMLAQHIAYGDQRRLEVARALACTPRILLLDEPVAGMNPEEAIEMARLIVDISGRGLTVLVIEHNLDVVMNLCGIVYVLNYGRLIARGRAQEIQSDPGVVEAYLGRKGIWRARG